MLGQGRSRRPNARFAGSRCARLNLRRRRTMTTMRQPATIIGGPASPYVRKVLALCEMKGVPYRLDPIVPFFGDERFSELNPLRRIPVFMDEDVSVSDSTVICEYLEERYPTPALLPSSPADRARARWI